MPLPQNTVSIPESVTINGVTYLVKETPELQQFIQAVAKVEKSKLYSQMESIKTQIQALGNVQVVDQNNDTFDMDSLVEKLKGTFVTAESIKDTISDTIREVVQPVLEATKRNEQNALDEYREKIINENIATCIPDLVKGNSKEELDAALQESIRLRSSYPMAPFGADDTKPKTDPLIEKQMQMYPKESPTPQGAPAQQTAQPMQSAPAAPRIPAMEATQDNSSVKKMTMSEFTKQRDALRANLESMYGGGAI